MSDFRTVALQALSMGFFSAGLVILPLLRLSQSSPVDFQQQAGNIIGPMSLRPPNIATLYLGLLVSVLSMDYSQGYET
jgi:hypothetical protein